MEKLKKYFTAHGYIGAQNFFIDDETKEFIRNNFTRQQAIIDLSKLLSFYSEYGNYDLIYNLTMLISECIHGYTFNKEVIHEIFDRDYVTDEDCQEFKRRVYRENNEVISCVYKITCKTNGKFYIGSTNDLIKRRIIHRFELKFGRHANKFLQTDFNLHGDENFVFKVVERVSSLVNRNDLYKLEQKYMDELNPEYNIVRKVTYRNSNKSKHKNKISFKK